MAKRKVAKRKTGKKSEITIKRKNGYITEVSNTKGKGTAYVVQRGDYTGFTALTPSGRRIDRGKTEGALLRRLSKKKRLIKVLD